MLLNIVKLRYGDTPVFLEVQSVITQYSIAGQVSAGVNFGTPQGEQLGGAATFYDRPTVTYGPMTGERFARSLMSPVPPQAVVSLIQAGYPVDLVMRICVQSINGLRNRYGGQARTIAPDPEFIDLLKLLRHIQDAGGVGMRVKKATPAIDETLLVFRSRPNPAVEEEALAARKALGLDPAAREFKVVYGSAAADDHEVALLTRSMLQILIDLSSYIEVPAADVAAKRVMATVDPAPFGALVRLQSSASAPAPENALVAVNYRDDWFWIDDRDLPSKSVFSFLMFVFTLTEGGGKDSTPLVTVPVGGP